MLSKVARGFEITFVAIQTIRTSETARNIIDLATFALGFVGIHNLIKTYYFKDREITELYEDLPLWQQRAWKIVDFLGNLSLILGGLKTRPVIAIWKWSVTKITSSEQLGQILGQHAYISGEKIHRIIGLLSLLLGIPATLKTVYYIYSWIRHPHSRRFEEQEERFYTPLPIRKIDVAITVKTVSETAQRLMATPRN